MADKGVVMALIDRGFNIAFFVAHGEESGDLVGRVVADSELREREIEGALVRYIYPYIEKKTVG